jgi:hypothetical protein
LAIEFSSVTAPTVAVESLQTLSKVRATSRSPQIPNIAFNLSDTLKPNRFNTQSVKLDINDAQRALSQAILAGSSIEKALKQLADLAKIATNGGIISSSAKLTIGGTRVSGLNIDTQINRAIGLLDRLVASANVGGANFISANSLQIKIQTTRFGGSLTITPQPLNSSILGIRGLDYTSTDVAAQGEARLRRAAAIVGARVLTLQQLQTGLGQSNSFNQAFAQFISSSSSSAVPTGTLINLTA